MKINQAGRDVLEVLLPPQQYQVALLICEQALGNKEIAERLRIRTGSIGRHLHDIYKRLDAHGQKELMLLYWTV